MDCWWTHCLVKDSAEELVDEYRRRASWTAIAELPAVTPDKAIPEEELEALIK